MQLGTPLGLILIEGVRLHDLPQVWPSRPLSLLVYSSPSQSPAPWRKYHLEEALLHVTTLLRIAYQAVNQRDLALDREDRGILRAVC